MYAVDLNWLRLPTLLALASLLAAPCARAQDTEHLDAVSLPPDVTAALKAAGLDPALVVVVGKDGSMQRLYDGDPRKAPLEIRDQPLAARSAQPLGEIVQPADGSAARYCYKIGGRWYYTEVATQ